ncbi:UNVERIFIED_CONTAM: hypothetical protein RMT77_016180 [Armadillidium vulgare]
MKPWAFFVFLFVAMLACVAGTADPDWSDEFFRFGGRRRNNNFNRRQNNNYGRRGGWNGRGNGYRYGSNSRQWG